MFILIGLKRGTIQLANYNPDWINIFTHERVLIQDIIGNWILDIQHIGSTSIPDMAAKPIIDIAIGVENFDEAHICIVPLEKLGYIYKGENGIPRRHFFTKTSNDITTFHLHMNEINSQDWRSQIFFRDYLTSDIMKAQQYRELKEKLAELYLNDRDAYLKGKDSFIEDILKKI